MTVYSAADLPGSIPVFPLPGALLLPRARLPLQIFEPRYLAMLDDTLKSNHRLVGMVQPGATADDDALHSIGCAGRVTAFKETGDGRYMITLTGISRFRIEREIEGFAPYRKCDVAWSEFDADLGVAETDVDLDRPGLLALLARYFEAQELNADWESLGGADDELLINSLSMLCPLDMEDKQALLEAPDLPQRREILVALLEFSLRSGPDEKIMQ